MFKNAVVIDGLKRITMKYIIAAFLMLGTVCINAQQEFSLNDESTLTIDGTSTIHDWTVNAEQLQGELTVDGGKPKKLILPSQ